MTFWLDGIQAGIQLAPMLAVYELADYSRRQIDCANNAIAFATQINGDFPSARMRHRSARPGERAKLRSNHHAIHSR